MCAYVCMHMRACVHVCVCVRIHALESTDVKASTACAYHLCYLQSHDITAIPWVTESMWRTVLEWLSYPGYLFAAALLFTVAETRRHPVKGPLPPVAGEQAASTAPAAPPHTMSIEAAAATTAASIPSAASHTAAGISVHSAAAVVSPVAAATAAASPAPATALASPPAAVPSAEASRPAGPGRESVGSGGTQGEAGSSGGDGLPGSFRGVALLLQNSPFVAITAGAALNDVASYALIAWQSTFYERVFSLGTDQYAPVLATILPISGIIGGGHECRAGVVVVVTGYSQSQAKGVY